MLVSIASFYATYLQANSAEQQVKAMTYPLIQYSTGNYSIELKESAITLSVSNSGVGPAIIKTLDYKYDGKAYKRIGELMDACCSAEYQVFKAAENEKDAPLESRMLTSFIEGTILSAGESNALLTLRKRPENEEFWNALNKERFKVKLEVCYCSLLDTCYRSEYVGQAVEVSSCKV